MSIPLKLIVGLGNPGPNYAETRHNAGVWFRQRVASEYGASFREERRFHGATASISTDLGDVRLMLPTTYMNESGRAVGAIAHFFRIEPASILICHDEIDLAAGAIKYKVGGGMAGHNGLRDVTRSLAGSQDYARLRIGVGKPDGKDAVIGHVLTKTSRSDRKLIDLCLEEAFRFLPDALSGEWEAAMNGLNGFRAT